MRTIYIGGQDAVDATGQIVGVDDIGAQAGQVFANIQTALEAAGAGSSTSSNGRFSSCRASHWNRDTRHFSGLGRTSQPTRHHGGLRLGLARPEFLVEIDAIAVVPL